LSTKERIEMGIFKILDIFLKNEKQKKNKEEKELVKEQIPD